MSNLKKRSFSILKSEKEATMDSYEILRKASEATDPYARKVNMWIKTLDPDYPYTLNWNITLNIPGGGIGHSQYYVFDFLVNFNELLLDVEIADQEIDFDQKERQAHMK